MIGDTLGHYEIRDKLGAGGMGEVYRAHDPNLGRDVAIKLIPQEFSDDHERLLRFEREARILASLNHPNVATVFGFEEDAGRRFLVMEFIDGEDLSQKLRRTQLKPREAVSLASQIARGLEAAHERGIIHRDLKPANVKVAADGSAKILDFGLANTSVPYPNDMALENSPTITADFTQAGAILGTAPYMSPEQAKGLPAEAQADIWAFGCVLFEMLTGQPAFHGDSVSGTIARILEREPEWELLPDSLPRSLRTLLRRCLTKDLRQRFHSTADIRIELEEAFEPATDAPNSAAGTSRRGVLLFALAAFALGAVSIFTWLRLSPRDPGPANVSRLVILAPDVVPLPECPSVAISRAGDYVVYVAAAQGNVVGQGMLKRANRTQLYLRALDGFGATPIDGTVGATTPFLSPDGEWIGFLGSDFRLRKVPRAGGTPTVIVESIPAAFRGATWAEDDKIYFAGSTSGIGAVDADGGEPEIVAVPDREAGEKTLRHPSALPGGTHLLVTVGSSEILSYDDATVAVLSVATGEIKDLVHGGMNPRYSATGHILYGRAGILFAVPFDLERLEVTGKPVQVVDGIVTSDGYGSAHADIARNGTLIYIAGGPDEYAFDLLIVDGDGTVERLPQPAKPYGTVEISPDGTRLALSVLGANATLWVYALERGTMSRIASGWDNHSPVWHPTENRIAFGSNRERSAVEAVWTVSATGSSLPVLVPKSQRSRFPSSWSHDGRWIAATLETPDGGSDIWFLDASDANSERPVLRTAAAEYSPRFSPDDRYVAYVSDESGLTEVYVQRFPPTGERWKISEDGGGPPAWAPDGSAIYYLGDRQIIQVPVEFAPDFRPGRSRVFLDLDLDDATNFDIFPDGERFAVIGRQRSSRGRRPSLTTPEGGQNRIHPARDPHVHVLLNCFELLNASPTR